MSPNSTNLVLKHHLSVSDGNDPYEMDNFSSSKFSMLYLKDVIPGTIKLYMLQNTSAFLNLILSIGNCMDIINANGGFTVIGWYKRGLINDQTLCEDIAIKDDKHVESGDINHHIVQIIPSNRNFLNPGTDLGTILNAAKFDAKEIR